MRPGRTRLRLLPALALLACGPEPPAGEATPLVDGVHAPLVLTESVLLEMPPSAAPNRFVRGWWPGRRGATPRQHNVGDQVLLEAVFLDGRERRLNTRLDVEEAAPGATFGVRVGGVELTPRLLVADAEVPLPPGLPSGRLPIELDLAGARVVVHAAGFGHAWPAGELELKPESIVQAGYSAIDFPRRLAAGTTLVGEFEAPAAAKEDQRFAVVVETDATSEVSFEWLPGGPPRAPLRLALPAGFVRLRLLAQGLGEPGRWRGLGLAGGGDGPAAPPDGPGEVPGRPGTTAFRVASERYELVWAPELGLADDAEHPSRDAEYVFDRRRDPERRRNLAGIRSVEVDWLRARLLAWLARSDSP